ncbi:STAS domain-containing protein [Actinoplanes sp. NPDC051475]|uniref:STAS domain-containing protein n=1 Tax=Actinoplanes sp. NPDC051475 TaxID=3157225 RepID=UPI00344EAFBC
MAHFQAVTSTRADRAVVALTGECDLAGRDRLTAVLRAALDSAELVVVDLAGLTFIDSSGIHGLVTAHRAAQSSGRRVELVNASGAVAAVLELTGVDRLLGSRTEDTAHD